MKLIPLTQGQYAIVDDEDYEELSKFKWHAKWDHETHSFYARRTFRLPGRKWRTEQMHRRILGLERGDKLQVDHINHKTLDNRRANIRIVTTSQNQHNRIAKGYYWDKDRHKFRAQIKMNGARKHLGYFDDLAGARAAYLAGKAIYHPSYPMEMSI